MQFDCNAMDTYIHAHTDEYNCKNPKRTNSLSKLAIRWDHAEEIPFSFPCNSSIFKHSFTPLKYLPAILSTILEAEKVSTIVNPS
jgi:hypothetical protein